MEFIGLMEETIFNLFLYTNHDCNLVEKFGVKTHQVKGSDQEKYNYLKNQVPEDIQHAQLFEVPKNFVAVFDCNNSKEGCIQVSSIMEMLQRNDVSVFEQAFNQLDAPKAPLFCSTVIEQGKPTGIMVTKKIKSNGTTFDALLRRGIDSRLANQLISQKYTLGKLKTLKDDELKSLQLSDEQIASINKGTRPPIPEETYIKVLYDSKSTCCVCRDSSKSIIIHHVEEWSVSKSHDEENLVVLCLEHHDLAHTKKELSINLDKKKLLEFKRLWLEQSRTADAEAILGLVSRDFSRWDYFNHKRIYELFFTLDIEPTNFKLFPKLNQGKYVDDLGILNIDAIQRMNSKCTYMYDDGNGFITVHYMKEVFEATLARLPVIDLTDKFNRSHIVSLLRPGSFIALQAGFYYKQLSESRSGSDQLRKGYYKKQGIKLEFTFDPYEATSSSAYNESLTGHSVSNVICVVKSIYEKDDLLNIDVSCLAVGSYFENCKFRKEKMNRYN
jgi:hypothetical protein